MRRLLPVCALSAAAAPGPSPLASTPSQLSSFPVPPASYTCVSSSPTALREPRRCKSYHFFMNLDDPEATRLRVEEDLARLASDEKTDSTAYLHSLLNLTLSHYQREDFIAAHRLAEYTHQKALAHNPKSSLGYFTATTCARCADALADAYEVHVRQMDAQSKVSAALTPKASVVFGAKRAITKLRADAERYRVIAQRIYSRPDLAFMRGDGGGGGRRWSSSRHTPGSDTRHTWQEGSSNSSVDEEYAADVFGERWRDRRKRPEHAEVKHFHKRQYANSTERGWTVPK